MNKHGVTIDCANCRFIGNQGSGEFDVVVPVVDDETDLHGRARLRCRISPQAHTVELNEWHCAEVPMIQAESELDRSLSNALKFVADQRLCGNRRLCPTEVVEVVAKNCSD